MRVALAVPCYIDQLRPATAQATLALLERLGCEVSLEFLAPCCGQPMSSSGAFDDARAAATTWAASAARHDVVVMPSGSCVHQVRHQLPALVPDAAGAHAAQVTFELCEFIAGPLGMPRLAGAFPHRVAMHLGCHALRGLRLGGSTELHQPIGGPMHALLSGLRGITIAPLDRRDECCGFGGTFSMTEPELSAAMGRDRLRDYARHDADVIVSGDVSCLMHLESLVTAESTRGRTHGNAAAACPRTLHIAELLEEATR